MKVTLTRTLGVGGHQEWSLDIRRHHRPNRADRERWTAEDAEKYRTALTAIEAAPESAEEIAGRVLDDADE